MAATTLAQFEAGLLPSASPALARGPAAQCAGACADAREQLSRGIPWAEAQARVLANPRHLQDLTRWGKDAEFAGLTGP